MSVSNLRNDIVPSLTRRTRCPALLLLAFLVIHVAKAEDLQVLAAASLSDAMTEIAG